MPRYKHDPASTGNTTDTSFESTTNVAAAQESADGDSPTESKPVQEIKPVSKRSRGMNTEHPTGSSLASDPQAFSQAEVSPQSSQDSQANMQSASVASNSKEPCAAIVTEVADLSRRPVRDEAGQGRAQGMSHAFHRRNASWNAKGMKPSPDPFAARSRPARTNSLTSEAKDSFPIIPAPRRTSPKVRLRLSLDGKAQVVTGDDDYLLWPEPLRPTDNSPSVRGLQRSQSAVFPSQKTTLNDESHSSVPWPRRPGPNRPQAQRSWELYCDNDPKDGPAGKGQAHQTGSAANTIAQLRAHDPALLRPNAHKRNAQSLRNEPAKRAKTGSDASSKPRKRGLVRARSSLPRLQTPPVGTPEPSKKPKTTTTTTSKSRLGLLCSPSGDSDKENWVPEDDEASVPGRRLPEPHGRSGGRHGEQAVVLPEQGSAGPPRGGNDASGLSEGKETDAATTDGTTTDIRQIPENFDAAISSSGHVDLVDIATLSRDDDDLTCVRNLLSLSQGNWG